MSCNEEMLLEIENIKEDIKNFSKRAEGMTDEMVLWMAESLVESVKDMIEKKKIIADNQKRLL